MLEYIDILLHIDKFINELAIQLGPTLYIVIFLIIFAETGLVFMPFLPGDSLLFAVGALSAGSSAFDIKIYIPLLFCAAVIGDSTNYLVGWKWGRSLFEKKHFLSRLFNKNYLEQTEEFYRKNGAKAVAIARFLPVFRTLAPFVGGLTKMPYRKFITLSVIGTFFWINIFCLAGYFFGQIPVIRENFTFLVMGIVVVSLLPFFITLTKHIMMKKNPK